MCALVIGVHSCALPISAGDCLYFASPPAFHLNYARDAFAQGRAVFCEKPLAVDVAEAEAFVAEDEKTGARAAVNFPFASMAGVAQLLRWMEDGVPGAVQTIEVEIAFAHLPRPGQLAAVAWPAAGPKGVFARAVGA